MITKKEELQQAMQEIEDQFERDFKKIMDKHLEEFKTEIDEIDLDRIYSWAGVKTEYFLIEIDEYIGNYRGRIDSYPLEVCIKNFLDYKIPNIKKIFGEKIDYIVQDFLQKLTNNFN